MKELRKDGISTTHCTVTRRIFQWTKGGELQDRHRPGWPSVITEDIAEYLDKMLEGDDELSISEFHRLIAKKFSLQISAPTIQRFLRLKLNWVTVRARAGPMISNMNKIKRVTFAKHCIAAKDPLQDVIWTDESSIQLVRHARSVWIKMGKEPHYKPVAKHPLKVHVWAGILMRGATKICIFDQTMDAPVYVDILKDFLIPFIKEKFPQGHQFMQDNDLKHTSRLAKEYME